MDITKKYGFSLFEFIIVLSVLGILAVGMTFSLQNATITVEGQAQQLANDIRYAQSLSMTRGQRYRWVKLSATTYQIVNSSGAPITLTQGNTTVTLNAGTTFGTLTNLPNNLIAFDGAGAPYTTTGSPGTALSASATIPLTASSQTKTVVISPGTGRIIVQ